MRTGAAMHRRDTAEIATEIAACGQSFAAHEHSAIIALSSSHVCRFTPWRRAHSCRRPLPGWGKRVAYGGGDGDLDFDDA